MMSSDFRAAQDETTQLSAQEFARVAGTRIAPTWPLDQSIAVNPWWELRREPFMVQSARLSALGGVHCLMSKGYYAKLWQNGIEATHLTRAAAEMGIDADLHALQAYLDAPDEVEHWHNFSDLLDSAHEHPHRIAWRDEITHQISQFCAAAFQDQGPLRMALHGPDGLYPLWLEAAKTDKGIEIMMGCAGLGAQFDELPKTHDALIETASRELGVQGRLFTEYCYALLLDVNGWASWAAYLRWQASLQGRNDALIEQLLAIRLAWDLVLWRHYRDAAGGDEFLILQGHWQRQLGRWPELFQTHLDGQRLAWVWQRAHELSFQEPLAAQLAKPEPARSKVSPVLQAIFCIDVRSEIMRRALEAQDPRIDTVGFAGFFGLPLEYHPKGTDLVRPQLPGLLKPAILAVEAACERWRQGRLNALARWKGLWDAPPAMFNLVESAGLMYAFKLVRDSFVPSRHRHPVNELSRSGTWTLTQHGEILSPEACASLCADILRAMGLKDGFASSVLLVGHGSRTTNNPHAAGLDCGACGGQTGEVNVRVLAQLLNETQVRLALRKHGILITDDTRFIPALHNTTTDDIDLLSEEDIKPDLQAWLEGAAALARRERSSRLGELAQDDGALRKRYVRRADDWSQVRPEWGLADNAAFIVAPRARTRDLNLGGRSFLHDYDWRRDPEFSVLELIMTAPMVVTHWINMQYNASVTDNLKYGCGNKMLHNVVGGNLGVFEGNGGDLRIGLPLQSLHDGRRWMHRPLRLSVYIAAPREAITGVYARHEVVRHLVDNQWLYLFRLGDEGIRVERLQGGIWATVPLG